MLTWQILLCIRINRCDSVFMQVPRNGRWNRDGNGCRKTTEHAEFHPVYATGTRKHTERTTQRNTQTTTEMFRYCNPCCSDCFSQWL